MKWRLGLSATWRRVSAIRWRCLFVAWLWMGSTLVLCSSAYAQMVDSNAAGPQRAALRVLAGDLDWPDSTWDAADSILVARPSLSVEGVLLELLKDRDHQTRRNALDAVARIGPSRAAVRQVSVLVERDPDPLCQAKARLFLAEFSSTVPNRLPDTSDAVLGDRHETTYPPVGWTPRPSGSSRTDEASILRVNQDLPLALQQSRDGSRHGRAASAVIRPPSMRDRIEPSDGQRVDTADFRVDDSPANFGSVQQTSFDQFDLPPLPRDPRTLFPEAEVANPFDGHENQHRATIRSFFDDENIPNIVPLLFSGEGAVLELS